jgi:hypothetical protein
MKKKRNKSKFSCALPISFLMQTMIHEIYLDWILSIFCLGCDHSNFVRLFFKLYFFFIFHFKFYSLVFSFLNYHLEIWCLFVSMVSLRFGRELSSNRKAARGKKKTSCDGGGCNGIIARRNIYNYVYNDHCLFCFCFCFCMFFLFFFNMFFWFCLRFYIFFFFRVK